MKRTVFAKKDFKRLDPYVRNYIINVVKKRAAKIFYISTVRF